MKLEYSMSDQKIANFIVFPVETTNIFPLANSDNGGQLMTEFNIRSRDTVTTKSNIEYEVGPSFVHGKKDFLVKTATNNVVSSTVLEITPGRALVNGHYLESFTDIFIDLAELNMELVAAGEKPYTGKLAIGLRAMYSTDATLSGSMLVEKKNADTGVDMYMGVQIVIGPQNIMKTPEEAGTDQDLMKCHLKLATFSFYNGAIRNLVNLNEKYQWLEAERIKNVDDLLAENYVSKKGLNPHKLYTYATKANKTTGVRQDTWCDATRSSFILDKTPVVSENLPSVESYFQYNQATGETSLILAHMQVDGMADSYGTPIYYDDKVMKLPKANYGLNTGGTVDKTYTQNIKRLAQRLSEYYHIAAGKQVYFLDSLMAASNDLPKINPSWSVGDYTLVANDYSFANDQGEIEGRPPASLYAVLPGFVTGYQFFARGDEDSNVIPPELTGVELEEITVEDEPASEKEATNVPLIEAIGQDAVGATPIVPNTVIQVQYVQKAPIGSGADDEIITAPLDPAAIDYRTGIIDISAIPDADVRNAIRVEGTTFSYKYLASDLDRIITDYTDYRGVPKVDYFTVVYTYKNEGDDTTHFRKYYYVVKSASPREWSTPILLTGTFDFASTTQIGGFLNVDDSYIDAGYVKMNEEGHLQLVDYALLRTGVLAYQLGENLNLPTGIASEEVQNYLDEYVNQRVAFPNVNQVRNSEDPNVIHVYIDLVEEEEETTINIYDIDSRFNTSIYLHFTGSANDNTTINILDIQKVRIDSSLTKFVQNTENGLRTGPVINVYRSGLYYDADVFNYIFENRGPHNPSGFTGMQDITLWYQRYKSTDPKIFVDGMTVRRLGDETSILVGTTNIAVWSENLQVNDYHYNVGLHGITFCGTGEVVGISILIQNSSTANVEDEYKTIIYNDMAFPNGDDFRYPIFCLTKPMKVTGEFITSYPDGVDAWIIQDTKFSLMVKGYSNTDEATKVRATLAIFEKSDVIPVDLRSDIASMSLDPWDSRSPHVFFGSILR